MVTALFALGAAGCALAGPGEGANVDPRVQVLPEVPGMLASPDAITIPVGARDVLPELAVGDVLVSTQGEGLLRKLDAIDVQGESLVLMTSEAELGDALIDAELATSVGGDGKADTYQLPSLAFTVSNKRILDNPAITARIVEASLRLDPEIDLDLEIASRRLQNFELVLRGRITGSIELEVDAREANVGPEIVLWQSPPAIFYQQVGILPVIETVTTSVVLRLGAIAKGQGRLRVDAGAIANLEGGVRYNRERGWHSVAELDVDVHGAIPEASASLTHLGLDAWLSARVDVRLYGLAGPYVAAGPQLKVVHGLQHGGTHGSVGFLGRAGGGLKIFRLNLPAIPSFALFDRSSPVL